MEREKRSLGKRKCLKRINFRTAKAPLMFHNVTLSLVPSAWRQYFTDLQFAKPNFRQMGIRGGGLSKLDANKGAFDETRSNLCTFPRSNSLGLSEISHHSLVGDDQKIRELEAGEEMQGAQEISFLSADHITLLQVKTQGDLQLCDRNL